MNVIGDSTPVRMALAVTACVAVAMISYQQGQIQASTPKEGQYVTSLVFVAKMEGVDTKLSALKDAMEAQLAALSTAQDLRLKLVESELGRLREDLARTEGENNAQGSR